MKRRTNNPQKSDLDKSDFDHWKKHPITKELFEIMRGNQEELKDNILTLDIINDVSAEKKHAYLRGSLEMCDLFLGMTFEQLFIKEEEKSDDAETPYTW